MARYKLPSCLFLDQSGNVVEDGTCSVFLAGTTTVASIYAASAGGVAVNSVTADSAGQCTWYVDTSDYATSQKFDITMSMTNFTPQTYEDIVVFPEVTLTGTETLTNKTLTSPVLTTPQINDTSKDHQYVTAVNELTADRTVTLPLLTGNDEYVFKAHTQTLTNKTLTSPSITNANMTTPRIYNVAGTFKYISVVSALTADRTVTLPLLTGNDEFTFNAHTQTLTNKTLTTPIVASVYQDAGKTKLLTVPDTASDTLTANAATQTLTNKTLTDPIIENTSFYNLNAGLFSRPKFEYIDANTIFIGAGQYWCKDKFCWWDAQLTSTSIGTPTASTMVYLYLDYSEITSGTEIVTAKLIWHEDPPAYDHATRSWLRTVTNTDDRCIMAVYSDGSQNITEFYHEDNYIIYADNINDRAAATSVANDWSTEATLTIPIFTTKTNVTFLALYVAADATDYLWRTEGQSGTVGHYAAYADINTPIGRETTDVITGSTSKIDLKDAVASSNNTLAIHTNGWYFGIGI